MLEMKTSEDIGGRNCTIYTVDGARLFLLQPVDDHDQSQLDSEVELISSLTDVPFNLVAFGIKDWMSELTPWPAPPTFGKQPFGDGAEKTLGYLRNNLIPTLQERWGTMKVILGGYSLAGLFALWVGYNSGLCDGVAAASPSVWYPQWTDYIDGREMHCKAVYLSLGDRESRTKSPVMTHVDDAIRKQYWLISAQGIGTVLEWNPGGHFVDTGKRMAKAFGWVCEALK
jgi:predicted alpha/beta superfamily hydrolase